MKMRDADPTLRLERSVARRPHSDRTTQPSDKLRWPILRPVPPHSSAETRAGGGTSSTLPDPDILLDGQDLGSSDAPTARDDLLAREKAYSQEWQRSGHWRHIWRCAGQYANLSIFAVEGNEQLHEILWGLPLFPYMAITITPLAGHPSDIAAHRTHFPRS
jgi:muconolactone D-isomerase